MKHVALQSAVLLVTLLLGSAARAATYDHIADYEPVAKENRSNAEWTDILQGVTATCDSTVGVQRSTPSASYRKCMLQHGWRYSHMTRQRAAPTPRDPYFSSNAHVRPGHFIDHDNGMDCQNVGGAEVCDPPNGTVRYFDPDQGLPCTRTGAMSICSNM